MAETNFLIPDGNNGNIPVGALPYLNGNNGGWLGGNGLGAGLVGFLIGALINNNGNGLFGGGNNNQMSDLIIQAVNNNGDRSVAAINQLSTMIGQDFMQVSGAIQTISTGINQIANNQGLNAMQIINALQAGNASLANQLQQCCCNMRETLTSQTNLLQQSGNQNTQAILAELRSMQTQALQDKLDAARNENTKLSGELSQLNQNQTIAAMIANAVNPIAGQLAGLRSDVESIKRCQPETITLPNNSMTAVPTLWATGVADLVVDRIAAALTPTTTPTTTPATT
jgi:hypothetical protein